MATLYPDARQGGWIPLTVRVHPIAYVAFLMGATYEDCRAIISANPQRTRL